MNNGTYSYDWSDLAFGSKKVLNDLKPIFIAAPRELSEDRFVSLVKQYLPNGNIVLGLAKEEYIEGFNGQPQFRTLQLKPVTRIIERVNKSKSPHKVYTLHYLQREQPFILEKLKLTRAVFINGSWQRSFHLTPSFYVLVNRRVPYELVSPFVSEQEAKDYALNFEKSNKLQPAQNQLYSLSDMFTLVEQVSKQSFDHTFQTGAVLGKKTGSKYSLLTAAYNKIVPYQTYAMHHGALRERHFSPPNDLNHYDTVHAEVRLILKAQQQKLSLKNTTMFINLMPCPTCARMLAESDITHFVYQHDHSDGYALKLLEAAGKKVERSALS